MGIMRKVGFKLAGVAAAAFALALVGCPGPTFVVAQYPGEERPQSELSILRINGKESVRLLTLDGQDVAAPLERDGRLHIELLPGKHSVMVTDTNEPEAHIDEVAFEGSPGKFYRVVLAAGARGPVAQVHEVDRGSDELGRDVTVQREPRSEPRRRSAPPRIEPTPENDAGPAEQGAGDAATLP
ncbi:hypothetical protein AKJ09_10897 [Labilithrix luteola]|uniref:DUF2846 domain-containing protein n=1 Tax=Labilithrix luteola TaxID=1391654 RepID=A0A0K1QEQ3_9BACT|nr:hypothetical protein [Labilithrix luteola]AKV04234.1 hypothetical protein AKJ09_10897 [Labilithrix luteola]